MDQATVQEIKGFFHEIRELYRETDRKFQETDRQIKETNKKIGELGNRLGEFVEEMVRPCAAKLFQERGVDASMTAKEVSFDNGEDGIEIDLLVRNGTDMVAVECKSKLDTDDVNLHLERLAKFKKYFPEYADKRVMGAVAAMVIPRDVAKYAYRKGLFVMAQSGEIMTILNDENFEPMMW